MIRWPNLGLFGNFKPCEDGVLEAINKNFFLLDLLVQMRITDFTALLPVSPEEGEAYIITAAQEGGDINDIMVWTGVEWMVVPQTPGLLSYILAEDKFYFFDGTDWLEFDTTPGDIFGPGTSTDNAIARFDGVTGKLLQDSGIIISDADDITGVVDITSGGDISATGTISADGDLSSGASISSVGGITSGGNVSVTGTIASTGGITSGGAVSATGMVSGSISRFGLMEGAIVVDSTSVGSSQALVLPTAFAVKFTGALLSVASIAAPPVSSYGRVQILINSTGSQFNIINGASIVTGTGEDLVVKNNAAIWVYFDQIALKWIVIGGSGGGDAVVSGGSLNFVTNPGAEVNTTGWNLYKDAASTRPVDGTGGTATNVTFTTSSTNPLNGVNSFLFTKAASNGQGEGVSTDFDLPLEFRAKALTIKVPYIVSSGTYVAGTRTTDSDVIVYFFDITNSKLVEASSFKTLSNSTTVSDAVQATVQFDSNCTQARMILHCTSALSNAFVLKLDDIQVGPTNYQYGTPVTDWTDYTTVISATSGALTNYTISNTQQKRVGDSIYIKGELIFTGAAGTWASPRISYPPGLTAIPNSNLALEGVTFLDSGVNYYEANARIQSNYAEVISYKGTNGAGIAMNNASPFSFGVGDSINWEIGPITMKGLSSSVQTSDQTDTRVVDFIGYCGSTTALTANTTNIPLTVRKDSHGGLSPSTLYTIQVPGDYDVSVVAAPTTSVNMNIQIYLNGVANNVLPPSISGSYGGGVTTLPNLKTGDTITFRSIQTLSIVGDTVSSFVIKRISGPSAIAASESVNAGGINSSGMGLVSSTVTPFTGITKSYDTHGAMNFSTGIYTVPINGKYRVTMSNHLETGSFTTGSEFMQYVQQLGSKSVACRIGSLYIQASSTGPLSVSGSQTFDCRSGDTLALSVYQAFGSTRYLQTDVSTNWFSIEKVG